MRPGHGWQSLAAQAADIGGKTRQQIRRADDLDPQPILEADRQQRPIGGKGDAERPRALDRRAVRDQAIAGVPDADAAIAGGCRKPPLGPERHHARRPAEILRSEQLPAGLRIPHPHPGAPAKGRGDARAIGRKGKMPDRRRQARKARKHPLRSDIEDVDGEAAVPRLAGPAADHGPAAIRRERDGVDLPLRTRADRDPQYAARLKPREGPEPDGLVIGSRGQERARRIRRKPGDRRGMGAGLDAQEGCARRLAPLGQRRDRRQQQQAKEEARDPDQEASSKPGPAESCCACSTLCWKLSRRAMLAAARRRGSSPAFAGGGEAEAWRRSTPEALNWVAGA